MFGVARFHIKAYQNHNHQKKHSALLSDYVNLIGLEFSFTKLVGRVTMLNDAQAMHGLQNFNFLKFLL
jgi:hypothetical protein